MPYSHLLFRGQTKDEVILFYSHRHYIHLLYILIRNCFYATAGSCALCAIIILVIEQPLEQELVYFLLCVIALFLFTTIVVTWMIWYLTLSVITDRRLIKMVQSGIFHHYSHEVKLVALQDTSYTYGNVIQNIFNYGTLVAHAASGEEGKFMLNYVPNPRDLHHYLNKLGRFIQQARSSGKPVKLPPYIKKKKYNRDISITREGIYVPPRAENHETMESNDTGVE